MQPSPLRSVLGTLHRLAGAEGTNDLSDADLLERFRARHEEAAFTLLVQRHGPMVLAVCRRVLGDPHDAEDAFQATFLVLVRRAGAIRKQASLASWLYGVAYRVAVKARSRAATRRAHERKAGTTMPSPEPPDALADPELRAALDEEMHQLPEKYRVPLVLCGLEGKTHEQAADKRWPKSSVTARLARGRDLLQRRLTGRGFAVTAVVLTALLPERAPAAVPARLTLATVRLGLETLTGTAAATTPAVALADHILKGMAMNRPSATLALLFTLGLVGAGLTLLSLPAREPPQAADAPKRDSVAQRPGDALPEGALTRLGSGRLRHGADLSDLAFSPDGKRLVTAGGGRLRVWDAATGRLERQFRLGDRFDRPVVAFSAEGALLSSDNQGKEDGWRHLDVVRGVELRRVALPNDPVERIALAVAAGGSLVAVAERDDVRLFDPATGKETLYLPVRDLLGFLHVTLSPDGKAMAVSDDGGGVIRVHDTTAGKLTAELKGEWDGSLRRLAFSPDGRSLAALVPQRETNGALIVWDVATGKERSRQQGQSSSTTFVFSPDGKRLAVSRHSRPTGLTLWDAADGKEVRNYAAGDTVTVAAFAPDGKTLAAATSQGAIVLWDVDTGKRLPQSAESALPVSQLQFTEGGKQLVGAAGDLIAWDPATGREVRRLPDARLTLGAVSASGKLLAVPWANPLPSIQLRDALTGETLRTVGESTFPGPRVICFTPDERRLIVALDDDKTILVLDVASGDVVHRLTGLTGPVTSLAASADGRWLASCSYDPPPGKGDEALRLWDLNTGREVKRLPHQFLAIWDLAFSPDGARLAAGGGRLHGSPPGSVQVWEVPAGKELSTIDTQTVEVKRVAVSPDGRTLAVGGWDGALGLWEVATGGERLRFRGHEGAIDALAFAPNGRALAAASADAPVFVWDVAGTSGPRQKLSDEDLRRCWDDLAGDAPAAFRAIRRLAASPDQALPFLREQLRPVAAADPKRLRQLFERLDSDDFARRQKAAAELKELADAAGDALGQEVRQTSSAEVRRALRAILDGLGVTLTGEQRRVLRAVEALETMGTPDAARLLAELADGAPSARLTREARAARDRLRPPRP